MSTQTSFIGELKTESANSRKILERVPMDKAQWKPHERSMSIGRLSTHLAETCHWIPVILGSDEFDFAAEPFKPHVAASLEELFRILDLHISRSIAALENATEEDFERKWTVKRGEQVIFSIPKKVAIRGWGFSHMIHHRGQLSVYLRLLDIPVPGMYGPSADEK
jgi:uncharacterized damage-inducible protein DinB